VEELEDSTPLIRPTDSEPAEPNSYNSSKIKFGVILLFF
jgi:hypothetical protein